MAAAADPDVGSEPAGLSAAGHTTSIPDKRANATEPVNFSGGITVCTELSPA